MSEAFPNIPPTNPEIPAKTPSTGGDAGKLFAFALSFNVS
jgi:hypothetical protein